eukprot:comp21128_c0_seq1/m.28560 comp21128_c0_seq1/g.28560  ORF comp21128_c0_seq1/g.28560 comp21128_c0_seq1/m.28560 type:complete len:234 (-) comp21128_c0_seq1:406-1107(-)
MEAARQAKAEAVLEKEHVHAVYDAIAPHFSSTRYKPWPRVEAFIGSFPDGALWADVGCGNGKYLGVSRERTVGVGSDMCGGLVAIAASRGHESLVADILALPYRTACFDRVVCIAVIHHMASVARRLAALQEMNRVLRPGGQMLVYVWAKEQDKFQNSDVGPDGDLFVPWRLQKQFAKETSEAATDQVFQRYYHLFAEGELEQLVQQVVGLRAVESGYDRDNWWVVAEKDGAP